MVATIDAILPPEEPQPAQPRPDDRERVMSQWVLTDEPRTGTVRFGAVTVTVTVPYTVYGLHLLIRIENVPNVHY